MGVLHSYVSDLHPSCQPRNFHELLDMANRIKYLMNIIVHRSLSAPLLKKKEDKGYDESNKVSTPKECSPYVKALASRMLLNSRFNFGHLTPNFWRGTGCLSEVSEIQHTLLCTSPRSQPTW